MEDNAGIAWGRLTKKIGDYPPNSFIIVLQQRKSGCFLVQVLMTDDASMPEIIKRDSFVRVEEKDVPEELRQFAINAHVS